MTDPSPSTPVRMPMPLPNPARCVLIVALTELFFVAATRWVLLHYPWWSIEAELIRTALRIITALVYWHWLKPLILSRQPDFSRLRSPQVLAGLGVFLSIPVLIGRYDLENTTAILFAATSIVVAVKEEFLFRGIVQNLLIERFGPLRSVLLTSMIFTIWHVGVWNPTVWIFAQIFVASVILGLTYIRSGSIAAVVVVHAVYDAVFSFTPFLVPPLNENWGFVPLLVALALIWFWALPGTRRSAVPRMDP